MDELKDFEDQIVFKLDSKNNIISVSKMFSNLFNRPVVDKPITDFIPNFNTSCPKIFTTVYKQTSIKSINNTVYYFLSPKDKNDPQEVFLAKMSHELKTLLNGIIGMTELLNDTILTTRQMGYMDTITQCSNQLLIIINDILDYAKMRTGKLKLNPEPFNVRECIEEALDIVALKATQKNLQLYQEPPKVNTISYIIADKPRLRQILINLLQNAIKYTDKGEVVISYSEDKSNTDTLLFSVRDTGCGIPEEKQKVIFDAFNPDISASSGTGLGLAIVKRLVEIMGGTISVNSKVGKGSIFTFTIKADLSHSDDSNNNNSPKSSLSRRSSIIFEDKSLMDKVVLIVDDKSTNRTILAQHVIKWYMKPIICGSAEEAMTYIDNNYHFDLVLVDIHMPETNGIELARQIRDRFPNLPIIAVSSLLEDPLKETSFLTDAISKPVKSKRLYTMIMRILKPEYDTKYTKELASQTKKSLKILLVEDVKYNQDVVVGYLKKIGYTDITTAFTGAEALNVLHSQDINIIFMDISMEPMDGFQTTKEVIKMFPDKRRRPLIIALTAHTNDLTKENCFKAGMNAYLSKPVEISKLKVLLEVIEKKLNGINPI